MKLFKHIAGLLSATAIAVGAWSCTDLDEVTFDRIDASTYYQDEQSVQSAVASIYASAASGFLEYFWYLNEFPADQIAGVPGTAAPGATTKPPSSCSRRRPGIPSP